jgi:hypothetical protein
LSSPIPKDKEAPQLPCSHTEIEAPKDKEPSPIQVMPPPQSHTTNPPLSSPYDKIHEDLALYKTMKHLDPTNKFFMTMKNIKSLAETSSTMSGLAQHAKSYMRACKIESYEGDGEVYN